MTVKRHDNNGAAGVKRIVAPQNAHELLKCLDVRYKAIFLARPLPLDQLVGIAEGSE
jgi:hypothetical protein